MFVRVLAAFILTMAASGAARASSFVVMGDVAPASTPSIITLGAPAPVMASAQDASSVERPLETPSIIALGEPLPEVTFEKVAAIPDKGPSFQPLVIRGGITGDAFAPATPAKNGKDKAAPAQQAAAAPKNDAPAPPPTPAAPPAYLPPNGYGKHRQ